VRCVWVGCGAISNVKAVQVLAGFKTLWVRCIERTSKSISLEFATGRPLTELAAGGCDDKLL
jgi:hypothetical protein